jgi:hypothetical protein
MEYELIRQLVLEVLREKLKNIRGVRGQEPINVVHISRQVGHLIYERKFWPPPNIPKSAQEAEDMLKKEDSSTIVAILWQLIVQGVLIPGIQGDIQTGWPFFTFTKYSKVYLETEGNAPYDPDGYLASIRKDSPNVDEVVMLYLNEGLQCFLKSNYIASAVMVGVAAEKVILNLIDVFVAAIADTPKADDLRRKTQNAMIKTQFSELTKRLYPLKKQLPIELSNDIETYLDGIFNLIRTYRNEAGHPSGKNIPHEIAYSNLQLFRFFSKNIHSLIQYLSKNKV